MTAYAFFTITAYIPYDRDLQQCPHLASCPYMLLHLMGLELLCIGCYYMALIRNSYSIAYVPKHI